MDLFSLTETEFFRKLAERKNDNLHIAYKDFVLQVSEICCTTHNKGIAVSALLFAEVEISHLQTATQRDDLNNELASFISKALPFVRQTISHINDVVFKPVNEDEMLNGIGLNWAAQKTALIELGYAFKVAKCFGKDVSVKEIVSKLAKAFNVTMPDTYIYKKYQEMRVRGRNSRTYFMDSLVESLNNHMTSQDTED